MRKSSIRMYEWSLMNGHVQKVEYAGLSTEGCMEADQCREVPKDVTAKKAA